MISSETLTVLHLHLPRKELGFRLPRKGRGQTRPPCDNLEIKIKSAYSPINMGVSSSYIYSNYRAANHAH